MAQVIVSPLVDLIFRNLASVAREEIQLVWGMSVDKELQNLKGTLSAIQAVLEDAEERQLESKAVQDWLQKLQDVAYDTDDLVDEIVTIAQQLKMESGTAASKKRKRNYVSSSLRCSGQDMTCRINEINVLLAKIATEGSDLHLETRDGSRLEIIQKQRQLFSSERDESPPVFGRAGDREQIIKSLLSDDSGTRGFSVVAIVGVGGVGKTTLANVVYNDKRAIENFELREWFCVPRNMDCLEDELWDKLIGKKFLLVLDNVWNEMDSDGWEQLQVYVPYGAKGSKILVTTQSQAVSDVMRATCTHKLMCLSKKDCWSLFVSEAFHNDNLNAYPDLLKIRVELVDKCKGLPLAAKALGRLLSSKREVREWENILKSPMWDLQGSASDILPALRLSYQHLPAHLKPCFIFCSIFPRDYKFKKERLVQMWIAHGFIRPEEGKQIEDTGSEYFNDLLSRSFFQPHYGEEEKEEEEEEWFQDEIFGPLDTGSKYLNDYLSKSSHLNDLSSRSFQPHHEEEKWFMDTIFGSSDYCFQWRYLKRSSNMLFKKTNKMNSLFHDLAKFISGNECFPMEQDKSHGILGKIRHLSHDRKPIKFESFCELKCLRTILSLKIIFQRKNEKVPHVMFQRLRFIRVLDLSYANITQLPNSIGNLRHLRYLNLSHSEIKELPQSICSIYCMQTLLLTDCGNIVRLPNEMRKLTNLRHLDLQGCGIIFSMPPHIGGLEGLQTLPLFIVGTERGRGIAELKELTDIRGKLVIEHLENVADAEHAWQANLRNKPLIDELTLVWGEDYDGSLWNGDCDDSLWNGGLEEKIAEGLKPHPNLKALGLWGYRGAHFPSWMMEMDLLLPNLQTLFLKGCRRCSILPPLGRLPSLSSLVIHRMDGVKQIDHGLCGVPGAFPSLENLALLDMRYLRHWCETNEESDFRCLGRLRVQNCPQLRQLPYRPLANLTWLCIRDCEGLVSLPRMPSLKQLEVDVLGNLEEWCGVGDAHFPHLQKLSISNCPKMRRWPTILPLLTELRVIGCSGFDALPLLPSLCKLHLRGNCSDRLLTSIPYLTSLSSLKIASVPGLTSMPRGMVQALTQLKSLEIWFCEALGMLVEEDEHLPSTLTHLRLYGCHSLEAFPEGLHALASLQTLYITNCPRLASLPAEGLPASLQMLRIRGCPLLKERCETEDWPKISHVPDVDIT